MTPTSLWWKNGTAYQIWPASYKDSNADGFGDIPGIISTLDYLKDLGIDIIWLSPHYNSPQHDMGYDISNYEEVWWKYGTMTDMDNLIKEVHSRGMKLILDLVVNHTSSEHRWFKESKKSKNNKYSDWYMWRDPKYVNGKRQPPNNWMSLFGGSAWEYIPERDQYYLHLFVPEQPDLNWENPITRKAIYKTAIEFWLDKGINGFRVDTVNLYSKNIEYPDASITNPGAKYQKPFEHVVNGPRIHEWLKEQRRDVIDKYTEIVLVGECGMADDETLLKYISTDSRELDMIFDFDMVRLGGRHEVHPHLTWKHELPEMKKALLKTQRLLERPDTWTTVFAENHDQGRSLSRFATDDPNYRVKAGKLMAIMLTTLSGTLFLYQGQEIGMTNIPPEWGPEELRDVAALNYLDEMKKKHPSDEDMSKAAMAGIQRVGRDNARTPVHWNDEKHAGFSNVQPWIRVHDNYKEINVAAQQKDPESVLAMWKSALKTRKKHSDILIHGQFEIMDFDNLNTFTYVKSYEGQRVLVVLNFSNGEQSFDVPPTLKSSKLALLMSNVDQLGETLSGWEARAYLVE